jgi:hypothetical protein
MTAWWKMMCDNNHRWEVLVDDNAEPSETEISCPRDGLPAITALPHPLADRAAFLIQPMASEYDGSVGHPNEYRFEIRSARDPACTLRSKSLLSWEDVLRYAELFRGIPWDNTANLGHAV